MNTTIQVSKETKDLIGKFGTKDETYETILKRICDVAARIQLQEFLLSMEDTIPIDEALKRAEKEWPQ